MKILVLGGTGLIGKQVSEKLIEAGHHVIIGSPSNGVDILTSEGLGESLVDTEVVVDLSNSRSAEADQALHFFRTAAKNIVPAEITAKVQHHVILSIVGTDRAQHIGYLQAKKEQEESIVASGIPYTIIRSTQFHEHTPVIIDVQGDGEKVHVSNVDYQPIAASDVVDYIVEFALEKPKNAIVEIAGPDRRPMNDFVEAYLKEKGDERIVVANQDDKYMFYTIPRSGLVPLEDFYAGKTRFDDWLKTS